MNQGGIQGGTGGAFADSEQRLGVSESFYGLTLGDIDNDGDVDVFLAGFTPQLFINQGFDQLGTQGSFVDSGQSFGPGNAADAAFADVDGDGDIDLYLTRIGLSSSDRGDQVFINSGGLQNGAPGVLTDSGQRLGQSFSAAVGLADFDLDGDIDFAAAIGFSGTRTYENVDRTGAFVESDAVENVGRIRDVAVHQSNAYAINDSGNVVVFAKSALTGEFTLQQTVTEGENGVRGIEDASAVAVSEDGQFVFVAGRASDSIAVFVRSATSGELTFAQLIRDGRSGVSGLGQPTAFAVNGTQLVVGTTAGRGAARGGFVVFDITEDPVPEPLNVATEFDHVSELTVTTGPDADRIRLLVAPDRAQVLRTTINAGQGEDLVNVLDASPTMSIDLGEGDDVLNLNLSTSTNGAISGGLGIDIVSVDRIGDMSQWTVAVDDNDFGDVVVVSGGGLPTTSTLDLTGDVRTMGQSQFDAIVYDGDPLNVTVSDDGSQTAGTITQPGSGDVSYAGFNNQPADPQQIFVNVAPRPVVNSIPGSIAEGDGLVLQADDQSGAGGTLTYEWDLDRDGDFGDAIGDVVSLSWQDLKFFGIADDGTFDVSVRMTRTSDAIPQLPAFEITAVGTTPLVVTNTSPIVSVLADTSVELLDAFPITFAHSVDPGNDRVTEWEVDWGDGTVERFGSAATNAAHAFDTLGPQTIAVTAIDEDGRYSQTIPVDVVPGAGLLSLGPIADIREGDDLQLSGTVAGNPLTAGYYVRVNAQAIETYFPAANASSPTVDIAWNAIEQIAGIDGSDTLIVQLAATFGGPEFRTAETTVVIANVAPDGVVMPSHTRIGEGTTDPVTVTVANLLDPSNADTLAGFAVSYDFGDDGAFDVVNVDPAIATQIPTAHFATSGELVIRARVFDDTGFRDLFTTIEVNDVAPLVTVVPQSDTVIEGDTLVLDVTVFDPGADEILEWVISWGDGTETAGTGPIPQQMNTYSDGLPTGTVRTIQVAVTTEEAIGIGTAQVTVQDVAPMVTLSSSSTSISEGSIENAFELDIAISDPGDDVVTSITIDWGDGEVETVAGAPLSVRHVYADVGTYTVSVAELSSADGVFAHPSNGVVVSVADVVPQIVMEDLVIPQTTREAESVDLQVLAIGSESGDDPLTITWDVTDPLGAPVAVEQISSQVRPAGDAVPRAEIGFRSLAHFVPVDDGDYAILLTIEDDDGNAVKHTATITVANRTPVIESIDVSGTIVEGETVVLSAAAVDPAGGADPLTYTWIATNSLTGQTTSFNGSSVNWAPTGGRYGIELVVEDDETGRATRSAALNVVATKPEITSLSIPATANESETATFSATAIDAASVFDDLAFTWRVERPDGIVEPIGGDVVSYRFEDDGDYTVTLVVVDPNGRTATSEPQIVGVGNFDPEITAVSIPNIGVEGEPLEFTATATDAATTHDPLNVQWVMTHPDGSITRLGGNLVNFTPDQDGVYTVRLNVDDSDGGVATRTEELVVANRVPAIDSLTLPSFAIAGLPERLAVEVNDSQGDLRTLIVEWRLTNTVTGEELVLSGATVDFVPDEGVYEVELTVSDGEAPPVQRTATIPVGSVVTDPDRVEGESLSLKVTNRHLGTAALTYAWRVDGPNNFVKRRLGRSVAVTPEEDGEFLARLSVTDGMHTVELAVPFDVSNARPVSDLSGPERTFQSEEVEFVIGAPADPGTDTVTEFVIDWGDGTQTTVTQPGPVVHTYSEAIGETNVALTVLDEDGVHENVATKTIHVEDYPTVAFAVQSYAVTEGGVSTTAPLELVRTGNLSVRSTVRLRLSGVDATPRSRSTASSDFDDTVLTVVFEPNVATQIVAIPVINDTISELDESFTISIVPGENAEIGENAGTVVSIEDDDYATLTISDVRVVEGDEEKTEAVVMITLNGTIDSPVRVLLETKDLTATAASGDYRAKSEELRFSGQANETKTFTVEVLGDSFFELDELFLVQIVAVNSEQREVSLPTRRSQVEITNDDEAPLPKIEAIEGTLVEGNPITVTASVDEVSGPAILSLEVYRANSLYAKRPPQSDGLFRFTPNDDGAYEVVLTAIDGLGNSQSVSQSILIENADPAIIPNSLELRLEQKRVDLTGSFTDPGRRDSHRVTIGWGDGTETDLLIDSPQRNFALEHAYQQAGQYSISIAVTDDDGATSQHVELRAFAQGVDLVAGDLWVVGSSGRDRVDISERDGLVRVLATFSNESRQRFEFPLAAIDAIRIYGLDGNDRLHIEHDLPIAATVYGGAGDDSIRTGSGNDYIDGGTGRDWIRGRDGNDEIVDLVGPSIVRGGDGDDQITTGDSDDWIAAGNGNDIVVAGDGRNVIDGGRGNDHITTGSGNDRIRGRDGDDVIEAGDGNNRVLAGDGDDIVVTGSGSDFVWLGDGNDVVSAGAGNDWFHGGRGHDLLIGGYGSDVGWGGRDRDLLIGETVENETDVSALSDARDDWINDNIEAALQDLAAYTEDEDRDWLRGGRHRDEILEGPNDRLTS